MTVQKGDSQAESLASAAFPFVFLLSWNTPHIQQETSDGKPCLLPLSMMETRDADEETHSSLSSLHRVASSQHVDDVGEEDQAHDGEKHQHQNVHHGEDAVKEDGVGC